MTRFKPTTFGSMFPKFQLSIHLANNQVEIKSNPAFKIESCFVSSLECGFVSWHGDGRVSAVESCDLELANHGEGGRPPKNYGFTFYAG